MPRTFPPGFRWGVATSGHQTEGGNTCSDTWFLEHVRPTVFREPSGRACNSYELWREDVDLVAGLGLDAYRFSVEWARVEPAEGEFSAEALAHYRAIAGLLCRGGDRAGGHLQPLHRAALVRAARRVARPGRLRRCSPGTAALVAEHLGDGAAWAVTLNEPNLPAAAELVRHTRRSA